MVQIEYKWEWENGIELIALKHKSIKMIRKSTRKCELKTISFLLSVRGHARVRSQFIFWFEHRLRN